MRIHERPRRDRDEVDVTRREQVEHALFQWAVGHVRRAFESDFLPWDRTILLALIGVEDDLAEELGAARRRVPHLAGAAVVASLLEVRCSYGRQAAIESNPRGFIGLLATLGQQFIHVGEFGILLVLVFAAGLVGDLPVDDQHRDRGISKRHLDQRVRFLSQQGITPGTVDCFAQRRVPYPPVPGCFEGIRARAGERVGHACRKETREFAQVRFAARTHQIDTCHQGLEDRFPRPRARRLVGLERRIPANIVEEQLP